MAEHTLLHGINPEGNYCTFCGKHRRDIADLDGEQCPGDREPPYTRPLTDLERLAFAMGWSAMRREASNALYLLGRVWAEAAKEGVSDVARSVAEQAENDIVNVQKKLRAMEPEAATPAPPPPPASGTPDDLHDSHPVVGQCCNAASRAAYGPCKYCGRGTPALDLMNQTHTCPDCGHVYKWEYHDCKGGKCKCHTGGPCEMHPRSPAAGPSVDLRALAERIRRMPMPLPDELAKYGCTGVEARGFLSGYSVAKGDAAALVASASQGQANATPCCNCGKPAKWLGHKWYCEFCRAELPSAKMPAPLAGQAERTEGEATSGGKPIGPR